MADGQNVPATPTLGEMKTQLTGLQAASPTVPMASTSADPFVDFQKLMATAGSSMQNVPGSNQPYQLAPALTPRMPEQPGRFATDRPQQLVQGTGAQQSQISQQNLASSLNNIVGGMANHFAQQKYQKNVSTIKEYTDAIKRGQEAANILKVDPNNQQAQQEAQSAQQTLNNLMTGKDAQKNLKLLQKAIPDFVNPENNGPEVGQAKAAAQGTERDAKQGVGDKTLQEKQVGQMNQMLQAKGASDTGAAPPPAAAKAAGQQQIAQAIMKDPMSAYPVLQKALNATPMQLQQNPAWAAQREFAEKMALGFLSHSYTQYIRNEGQKVVQDSKNATTLANTYIKEVGDLQKVTQQGKDRLTQQYSKNATALLQTKLRVDSLVNSMGSVTNPRAAGMAGLSGMKQLKDMQTVINGVESSIAKDEGDVIKMQQDAELAYNKGEKARGDEIAGQIEEIKQRMKGNNEYLNGLNEQRDSLRNGIGNLPPGTPGLDQSMLGAATGQQQPTGGAAVQAPTSYTPGGGYQQWMPMVAQVLRSDPKYNNIPPALAQAILMSENAKGNPNADPAPEKRGGQGLFQIIPGNQKTYGITNPFDPVDNTTGAMNMLSDLISKSGGDIRKAIYGYAPKDGSDPGYTNRVFALYKQLAAGGGQAVGQAPASADFSRSGEAQEAARQGQVGVTTTQPGMKIGGMHIPPSVKTAPARPSQPGEDDSKESEEDAIKRLRGQLGTM